jgi:hypothetical protein
MAPSPTPAKATEVIPYLYRFLLTNVESIMAVGGVIMALVAPGKYLSSLTRETITTSHAPADFIFTQLAGAWAYIAFSELVILRNVDDARVWRYICAGILCSDALYTHSLAQALGGWTEWLKVGEWTMNEWAVAATTFPFVLTRIAIVAGVGLRYGAKERRA